MKRILYSSGSVLTGDEIAHAVALYATSLARAGQADTVSLPVIQDGVPGMVEIVIGPTSQLIVEDAGDEFDADFDAGPYLERLAERRRELENPPAIQPEPTDDTESLSLDDL
ncbi:MAG: hypothetical protein ACOH10_00940 [Rhodoglobus sp.]